MIIARTPAEYIELRKSHAGKSLGFAPTMGALHAGHESLLQKARMENEISVLSIFVNPTQFNDKKDFEKYPQTWDADLALAEKNGVDIIFAPTFESIYPDQYTYKIIESDFSKLLCGKDRPGHFDGVLTIVMKLFQIVQPTRAYFGEKDFQQLTLIQNMVKAFFLPVTIVPCPTLRESDGLAMSSRNVRLSTEDRKKAPEIYRIINQKISATEAHHQLSQAGFGVDYCVDLLGRRFVAVRLGEVRLIDNVQI